MIFGLFFQELCNCLLHSSIHWDNDYILLERKTADDLKRKMRGDVDIDEERKESSEVLEEEALGKSLAVLNIHHKRFQI